MLCKREKCRHPSRQLNHDSSVASLSIVTVSTTLYQLVALTGCCLTTLPVTKIRKYIAGMDERIWSIGETVATWEKRNTRRKVCPCATLSTINLALIGPELNPDLRVGKPATNRLSHRMARPG
jgi:hypothetical protein